MINKAILLGRLGKDPETKTIGSGQSVCSFSIATTKNWTDRDGQSQERTEWHTIEFWGRQAEICQQYLKKGLRVYIEGEITTQTWDKDDGTKGYKTVIRGNQIRFLGQNKQSIKRSEDNDQIPF